MDVPSQPDHPLPIEDYGLIGDCATAALVGRNGSIDWLCWPRFDSGACFAALLGDSDNGRWKIAPASGEPAASRRYQGDTLVMVSRFETAQGVVELIDLMPAHGERSSIVRIVVGVSGTVDMRMDLALRFDYGAAIPWVERLKDGQGMVAIAGPEMVVLRSEVPFHGENLRSVADFTVTEGQRLAFVLTEGPSHLPLPIAIDPEQALRDTVAYWTDWAGRCSYQGPYREAVVRSMLTLKAMTFRATGGIVAAVTTSLPEQIGGQRNWDYRFCWLRDASLTLFALMEGGYYEEAGAWRDWLHRSVAGSPDQIQIMYGLSGERRLDEWTVPWLSGYENSLPVRIGNAASDQLQLDVYGEVTNALHQARAGGLIAPGESWALQTALLSHLGRIWVQPDEGIWEVRGERQHFTFSKVMAWLAFDRAVQDAEKYDLPGPLDEWRALRDRIHAEICDKGFDATQNAFTQSYGSSHMDASALVLPLVNFLPGDDPRMVGTVAAVERDLMQDGFVLRYRTESTVDGLPPGEGAFLACSFWLVSAYLALGRQDDAKALFEKLLGLRNDLGLLAEEYDPHLGRQVGNFPQAFSHLTLAAAAMAFDGHVQR